MIAAPKSNAARGIFKRSTPLFSIGVVMVALIFSCSARGYTISYLSDNERASLNTFFAGLLDFTVSPENLTDIDLSIEGDEAVLVQVFTPAPGSFNTEYSISAEYLSGAPAFCNAIQAQASTSPFIYNGQFISLSTSPTTTMGSWTLSLLLPPNMPGVADGNLCVVDLVYRGWREGALSTEGYNDEERVHLAIHATLNAPNALLLQNVPEPLFDSVSEIVEATTTVDGGETVITDITEEIIDNTLTIPPVPETIVAEEEMEKDIPEEEMSEAGVTISREETVVDVIVVEEETTGNQTRNGTANETVEGEPLQENPSPPLPTDLPPAPAEPPPTVSEESLAPPPVQEASSPPAE